MARSPLTIDRRTFIRAATAFGLVAPVTVSSQIIERARFSREDVPRATQGLLEMVNGERNRNGLSRLELDQFACRVAEQHAMDMIEGDFLSHWGRDGRKPYQRYSFAGGTDATQENASLAHDIESASPAAVIDTLGVMHRSMYDEAPPNDGHRKTILFPHHTHVGFGIATKEYSVRLDEIYICRYVTVDPVDRAAKRGSRINFSGRLLYSRYELSGIHVYHEPLPRPPSLEWLRVMRSYGMPDTYIEFLPRLPLGYSYEDGTRGSIEINGFTFRAALNLFDKPAINTIVVWLQRSQNDEPFPATQVCIRCE
jgi:uncharacterized protein YkwD